ncbi:MAG: UDP-N-acetylmuramoyl-tripeptide--D-alanyl-D-alanine ligase [Candidatus Saccharimonadales bacterium]
MFKSIVERILRHYVKRYLKKYKPTLVVVVGSVGKTSTKMAIATILSEKYRVRTHEGNHNTPLSAPLAIMGVEFPDNPRSVGQWLAVFAAARLRIRQPKDVDVIVQELATDHPGEIPLFASYLRPDIAVITAVGLEHMEYFKRLEVVAKEELSIAKVSKLTIVNRDDVDQRYAKFAETNAITTYGTSDAAEYHITIDFGIQVDGMTGTFVSPDWEPFVVNLQVVGEHNVKAVAAAGVVGAKLGLTAEQIATGMAKVRPVPGRMNRLRGLQDSILIDDTYNSSPMAVAAALKTLYSIDAPQRIAILGSMNEFGELSPRAHEAVGALCDPTKLDWVVTIGSDAANYLAPAAQKKGCQVRAFSNPFAAGGFAHSVLKPNALVLIKGSQNGVFAEEATKVLLHDNVDEEQLVRQDPAWMAIKEAAFDKSDGSREDV